MALESSTPISKPCLLSLFPASGARWPLERCSMQQRYHARLSSCVGEWIPPTAHHGSGSGCAFLEPSMFDETNNQTKVEISVALCEEVLFFGTDRCMIAPSHANWVLTIKQRLIQHGYATSEPEHGAAGASHVFNWKTRWTCACGDCYCVGLPLWLGELRCQVRGGKKVNRTYFFWGLPVPLSEFAHGCLGTVRRCGLISTHWKKRMTLIADPLCSMTMMWLRILDLGHASYIWVLAFPLNSFRASRVLLGGNGAAATSTSVLQQFQSILPLEPSSVSSDVLLWNCTWLIVHFNAVLK